MADRRDPEARATINDVAAHAGVSLSTVSAVINDKPFVRDSTREQVLAAIRTLNYRPRPAIRRPAAPPGTRTVAFILREPANPYYAEIIAGADEYLRARGYRMLVGASFGVGARERELVDLVRLKDFDGVLLTPVLDRDTDLAHLFDLRRRNIRFVLLEEVQGIQASLVDVDNVDGAKKGARHLIDLGHTRIAHFTGPMYSLHSEERLAGVRAAFSESALVFSEAMVVRAGDSLSDGYAAALGHFRDRPAAERPTGVTCYNDLVALGVCRALTELGLRVPDDVSVVGYDDVPLSEYVTPSLTSVHVPKREVGRIAAELLHAEIDGGAATVPEKVYLQAELVARASSAAPADRPPSPGGPPATRLDTLGAPS
jgi:LacI family transcriptional regulator/LacI family repressor for deo operon, udp, cdd, tsx, nupC, and nupG